MLHNKKVLLFLLVSLLFPSFSFAAPLYTPGQTLNPSCLPSDPNCTVTPAAASGANSDITSLSALVSATTTNFFTSALTLSNLSGILFGANGVVSSLQAGNDGSFLESSSTSPTGFAWAFASSSSATISWGAITGSISGQLDLQNALNAKLSTTTAASTYLSQASAASTYLPLSASTSFPYIPFASSTLYIPYSGANQNVNLGNNAFAVSGTSTFATTSISQLTLGNGLASSFLAVDQNGNVIATTTPAGGGGSSQWTTSGNDIYYPTGRVAIGTSTENSVLYIASSTASDLFDIASSTSANNILTVKSNGLIGIGTSTPAYPLTVEKDNLAALQQGTTTGGLTLVNSTFATAGVKDQESPSLVFLNQSWGATASTSGQVGYEIQAVSQNGSTPGEALVFSTEASTTGSQAGFNTAMTLSAGNQIIMGNTNTTNLIANGNTTNGFVGNEYVSDVGGIGTSSIGAGFVNLNSTAATAGSRIQSGGAFFWQGNAWATSTGNSKANAFFMGMQPTTGSSTYPNLVWGNEEVNGVVANSILGTFSGNGTFGVGTTSPIAMISVVGTSTVISGQAAAFTPDLLDLASSSNAVLFRVQANGSTTIVSLNNAGFVKSDANGNLYNDTNTYISGAGTAGQIGYFTAPNTLASLPVGNDGTFLEASSTSPTGFAWAFASTTGGGGSVAWGAITGSLSGQVDLQNALNAKLSTTSAASTYVSFPYASSTYLLASASTSLPYIPLASSSSFVPYTGANQNVNLNNESIVNVAQLGVGTSTPAYPLTVEKDNLAALQQGTTTGGLTLVNSTFATAGVKDQESPSLVFLNQSWGATASTSGQVGYEIQAVSQNGSTPGEGLVFSTEASTTGSQAGFNTAMTLSAGNQIIMGNTNTTNLIANGNTTNGFVGNEYVSDVGGIGTSSIGAGFVNLNSTAATAGSRIQSGGAFFWQGNAWATSTGNSKANAFFMGMQPTTGSSTYPNLVWGNEEVNGVVANSILGTFSGNGTFGVGTTSPIAMISVVGTSTVISGQAAAFTPDLLDLASSTNTVLFTVKSTGNVGIGTTTPNSALSVSGTSTTQGLNISNLANTFLAVDGSGNVIATSSLSSGGISNAYASSSFVSFPYASSTFPTFAYASSTYYLASNPNNYISSFTETDPIFEAASTSLPYIPLASSSSFVPYTGANQNVNLNNESIVNVAQLGVGTSTPAAQLGVYGQGTNAIANFASSSNLSVLYIAANGFTGFGTTTPNQKLDITEGAIRFDYLPVPPAPSAALAGAGAGNVPNGSHIYRVTYVNAFGDSMISTSSAPVTVVDNTTNGQVTVTIPVSSDPSVTNRRVWRSDDNGVTWKSFSIGSVGNNTATTFTDNLATPQDTIALPTAGNDSGDIFAGTTTALTIDSLGRSTFQNALAVNGGKVTDNNGNLALGVAMTAAQKSGIFVADNFAKNSSGAYISALVTDPTDHPTANAIYGEIDSRTQSASTTNNGAGYVYSAVNLPTADGFNSGDYFAMSKTAVVNNTATSTGFTSWNQLQDNGTKITSLSNYVGFESGGNIAVATPSLTNQYDFRADSFVNGINASTTNRYGLYLGFDNTGITNAYGVYQTSPAVSNFFGGKIGIGTSTPAYPLTVEKDNLAALQQGTTTGGLTLVNSTFATAGVKDQESPSLVFLNQSWGATASTSGQVGYEIQAVSQNGSTPGEALVFSTEASTTGSQAGFNTAMTLSAGNQIIMGNTNTTNLIANGNTTNGFVGNEYVSDVGGIGTSSIGAGFVNLNSTAATAGSRIQSGGAFFWQGNAWATSTGNSKANAFFMGMQPTTGSSTYPNLVWGNEEVNGVVANSILGTFSGNGTFGVGTTSPIAMISVVGTSTVISGQAAAFTPDLLDLASSTNTVLFTVKSTGNVGIGTSSPAYPFVLQASSTDSTYLDYDTSAGVANSGGLVFRGSEASVPFGEWRFGWIGNTNNIFTGMEADGNSGIQINDQGGETHFTFGNTASSMQVDAPARISNTVNNNSQAAFAIQENASQTANLQEWGNSNTSPYAVVTNNGLFGIGAITPSATFQISNLANNPSTNGAGIGTTSISSGSAIVNGLGTIFLNTFKVGDLITIAGQTNQIASIQSNTQLTAVNNWTTTSSNATYSFPTTPVLTVRGNGDIGFGTTTPNAQLSVVGFSSSTLDLLDIASSSGSVYLTLTSAGELGLGTTTPGATLTVGAGGTEQFANFGAGTLTTDSNGNVTESSDERLKNIDGDFTRGLTAIEGLTPINYHWNATSGLDMIDQYTGFSAQNVQAYIPEAVATGSNGYLALSDRPIEAALVNSIKEIGGFIDSIQGDVAYLKTIVVEHFTVGSAAKPDGITMFDQATGQAYCVVINNGNLVHNLGACGTQNQSVNNTASVGNTGGSSDSITASSTDSGDATSTEATSTSSDTATSTTSTAATSTDTTAPVITITGGTPITIGVGSTYTDLGATAVDDTDGDITSKIVTTGLPIDTSVAGTFSVVYTVSDNAGNTTVATRTVNVIAPPNIGTSTTDDTASSTQG